MTAHGGPDLIQDGLALALDAGNRKSYPGSGTVWNDLSGNGNTGTLTNGPTFNSNNGGSIVFDGSNDVVTLGKSLNVGNNFTVGVWAYPTLLGTTRRNLVLNGNDYGVGGVHRNGWILNTSGAGTNNTFFLSIGNDTAYRVAGANTLNINEWTYLVGVVTNGGESITLYKNGREVPSYAATVTSPGTISYTFQEFNMGYRQITGTGPVADPFTGNIAVTQLYNRALSAQEILQNFIATRKRFGL